ncbi:hypothetical protein D515_02568 [Grimontia indica]|uniref:Uncharacterized protein n=1 Tax=Grimontia indica TaxID=1056512 RepID=R1GZH5_9GAMM|nr:hypothetical protein D515_02568 [Grimontia indica]
MYRNTILGVLYTVIITGVLFNVFHSLIGLEMLYNETNRALLLTPYYIITFLMFIIFLILVIIQGGRDRLALYFSFFILMSAIVYFKEPDISYVKRVLVYITPLLFFLTLLSSRRDYSVSIFRAIKLAFYLSLVFSFLQLFFIEPAHHGRINGIFQGPNSYAVFLIAFLMICVTNKSYKLGALSVILIVLTKSSTSILILFLACIIQWMNWRSLIFSLIISTLIFYTLINVYTVGQSETIDKIVLIVEYISSLDISELKYLSEFSTSLDIPNVDERIISPLNRIVQFNYFLFNTSITELIIGSYNPRFYESSFLMYLSNFGFFGLILYLYFFFIAKSFISSKLSSSIFCAMFILSVVALPIFSLAFSSWLVMSSIYISIIYFRCDLNKCRMT